LADRVQSAAAFVSRARRDTPRTAGDLSRTAATVADARAGHDGCRRRGVAADDRLLSAHGTVLPGLIRLRAGPAGGGTFLRLRHDSLRRSIRRGAGRKMEGEGAGRPLGWRERRVGNATWT